MVSHFRRAKKKCEEEERRREEVEEEEEKEEKEERYGNYVWMAMILYGNYFCIDLCMDFWTFVWVLVCSISRVYLGIHPNPKFVESWVGKTLVCIR